MKIELPVRWVETVITDDDGYTPQQRRIIFGEEEGEMEGKQTKFTYDRLILDTEDIRLFHGYDEDHFILKTYQSDAYCIHLNYEVFKDLYMNCTNSLIREVERVEFPKED